jgi:hypothetical protein
MLHIHEYIEREGGCIDRISNERVVVRKENDAMAALEQRGE